MHRRSFLKAGLAVPAVMLPAAVVPAAAASRAAFAPADRSDLAIGARRGRGRFKLGYAPHAGMFRHHAGDDVLDQIRFMADEGFWAFEDNGMAQREPAVQEQIGELLRELDMQMGVFVAHAEWRDPKVSFVSDSDAARERIAADMRNAVEVAKRCGARWCTVVPGPSVQNVEFDYQTARVIDNLRRAAAICESTGLVMVLEPLNPWANHPGCYLSRIPQAYLVCRGVDSQSCKILDDLYHQQITEGNLIPNIDLAWSEIAYFQVGDNPGRNEPGTGEIAYRNVFRHIHSKGFQGVVGMEHGNSMPDKAGERAVIDAYVAADSF